MRAETGSRVVVLKLRVPRKWGQYENSIPPFLQYFKGF